MKDETKPMNDACTGLHNHEAKNDGPDETPVHEDLYHDDGRRNPLEDEEEMKTESKGAASEKGDDL